MSPSDQLERLIRVARRTAQFWRTGLIAVVSVAAVTLAVAQLRPKQYRSEAVVYYREGLQWTANEAMSTRRIGQRLKDMLLARAQLAKFIDEMGLYPNLVQSGRMAEAVEEMRLATGFKVERDSDVFVISFTGDSREEAQRVTAKLTDVLIGENARLRAEQAEVARDFLDAEKKRNERELAAKEAEQFRFLAQHPEFANEQSASIGSSLRAKSKQGADVAALLAAKDDNTLAVLRREEERLRRQIKSPGQILSTPRDPALLAAKSEAEAKVRLAKRELADRRARFTEQHPEYRAAAAMVQEAEEAYRRASEALDAAATQVSGAALEARLAKVQHDITAQQRKPRSKTPAAGDALEGSDSAKRIVAVEAEWARLSREVVEARQRLQQLDTRQFMASMTASMLVGGQTAQIVVIDPAYLPAQPIGMRARQLYLMGIVLALLLGVGLAGFRALMDDRLYDHVDVERLELAPVLADIPAGSMECLVGGMGERANAEAGHRAIGVAPTGRMHASREAESQGSPGERGQGAGHSPTALTVPRAAKAMERSGRPGGDAGAAFSGAAQEGRPSNTAEAPAPLGELVQVYSVAPQTADPCVVMLEGPDSPAAATFRVLRHRIGARKEVRTILVTSPSADEGKSSCAANLALALGEAGQAQVLLLEANFRSPSLARLFGFRPPVCVSHQLEVHRTRPTQPWLVVETMTPWLHTAVVAPDKGPRPILDGAAFATGIKGLRRIGYDYIVIDGPSTLGSADVTVMEESVDGILMAVRAGRSRAAELRKAIAQVGGNKLLGFVLFGA